MCISACPTQDHASWGACRRANGLAVTYCRSATNPRNDATYVKKWDRELDLYQNVRKEGIQPDSTRRPDIEYAMKASDRTGVAYGNGSSG
jgi:hypothetical protein